MWSKTMTLSACLVAVLSVLPAVASDGFDTALLESTYSQLTPAMGVVRYSSEVTNANTGESSKRENNALALVVTPQGLLMTFGHVKVEDSVPFNISVTLGQGDSEKDYEATLLGKPADVNVAFLQLKSDQPLNLPCIKFSPGNSLGLAEPVAVFGLLGDTLDFARGLHVGRISSVVDKPRTTYCLDEAVRFGFVGGPVVDTQGRVVGVVGFDLSAAEGGELYIRSGHPLVYQTELFAKYIQTPPNGSAVPEGAGDAWLGVFTQPLTDDFATYWKIDPKGGLIVSTVVPGSPAHTAGLQEGDVIVSFNGSPIRAKQDRDVMGFTQLVREAGAGKAAPVRVLRKGQPVDLTVTLGERPRNSGDAEEYTDDVFGLTVRELTRDVRIRLNLSEDVQGVIVRTVKSGSTAQVGKMQPGVIVMAIGEVPVRNLEEYKAAIAKAQELKPTEVAVFARLGSETGFFRLEPVWK